VVSYHLTSIHHRDTENTEVAQRKDLLNSACDVLSKL